MRPSQPTSAPWVWTRHHSVIVSKDSDFRPLAFVLGAPPKAVWLRGGNCSTATIAELLHSSADIIARFMESEEEALLVLPDLEG